MKYLIGAYWGGYAEYFLWAFWHHFPEWGQTGGSMPFSVMPLFLGLLIGIPFTFIVIDNAL